MRKCSQVQPTFSHQAQHFHRRQPGCPVAAAIGCGTSCCGWIEDREPSIGSACPPAPEDDLCDDLAESDCR